MQQNDLDRVYTQLCQTMTAVGEDMSRLFLARFALLATVELGEPDVVCRLIAEAGAGLTGADHAA